MHGHLPDFSEKDLEVLGNILAEPAENLELVEQAVEGFLIKHYDYSEKSEDPILYDALNDQTSAKRGLGEGWLPLQQKMLFLGYGALKMHPTKVAEVLNKFYPNRSVAFTASSVDSKRSGLRTRGLVMRPPQAVPETIEQPKADNTLVVEPLALTEQEKADAKLMAIIEAGLRPKRQKGEPVTIENVRMSDCRWPLGDPASADFEFCGLKSAPGSSYCEAHRAIAHKPPENSKGKAGVRPANSGLNWVFEGKF